MGRKVNFSSVGGGRDSADVAGAYSAAKSVVEGAGATYDAPRIEPNRKSLINASLIGATMSTAIAVPHLQRKPELPGHCICNEDHIERSR